MPTVLVNKFRVNASNQVVSVGSQDLITMQSGTLLKRLENEGAKENEQFAQGNLAVSSLSGS